MTNNAAYFSDFVLKAIETKSRDLDVVKISRGYYYDIDCYSYIIFYKHKDLIHTTQIAHKHLISCKDNIEEVHSVIRRLVALEIITIDECLYSSHLPKNERNYKVFHLLMSELVCFYNLNLTNTCPYTYEEKVSEFIDIALDLNIKPIDVFKSAAGFFFNDWDDKIQNFNKF